MAKNNRPQSYKSLPIVAKIITELYDVGLITGHRVGEWESVKNSGTYVKVCGYERSGICVKIAGNGLRQKATLYGNPEEIKEYLEMKNYIKS